MNRYPIPPLRIAAAAPAGDGFHVLYDADCGICSRCMRWLARRHQETPLVAVPLDSDFARSVAPHRPPDEMGLVGPRGEVWFGGDAWVMCLWVLPAYRWIARILAAPAIRPLVRFTYARVARNRHRISRLFGGSCRIP